MHINDFDLHPEDSAVKDSDPVNKPAHYTHYKGIEVICSLVK